MVGKHPIQMAITIFLMFVIVPENQFVHGQGPVPVYLQPDGRDGFPGAYSGDLVPPKPGMIGVVNLPTKEFPIPSVAIRVKVPAESNSKTDLIYRIEVENVSRAAAHHVQVRVTIPIESARFIKSIPETDSKTSPYVWNLGTLAPSSKKEIQLVVEAVGENEVNCCARVQFEHGQCVRTRLNPKRNSPSPAPKVEEIRQPPPPPAIAESAPPPPSVKVDSASVDVQKLGPKEIARYDIINFRIEVRNPGLSPIQSVTVRETLPSGLTFLNSKTPEKNQNPLEWTIASLQPGETRAIEYQAVAKEVGIQNSQVVVEGQGITQKEAKHSIRVGQPEMKLQVMGPSQRDSGRNATYYITVANPGTFALSNIQLSNELPSDIEFVGASDGGRFVGNRVQWKIGPLGPGEKRSIQLLLKSRRPGTFKSVVTGIADRGLSESSRCETNFNQPRELSLEVDPSGKPLEVEKTSELTFRLKNNGKARESNLVAQLLLPSTIELVEIPGVQGHQVNGQSITLPKRNLEPGEETYITIRINPKRAETGKVEVSIRSDRLTPQNPLKHEEAINVLPK